MMNIKCRTSGILPDCAVIVATVRALKMHGGGPAVTPGTVLAKEYCEENLHLLQEGVCNLKQHVQNIAGEFNLPIIVAINTFSTDTEKELNIVKEAALSCGASDACVINNHSLGGEGAVSLAKSAPKNHVITIRDINIATGGGYLYPYAGDISTMPGLPTRPAYFDIDIDPETEEIKGLF
ncbi:hypothetical protein RND71_043573 [Anisodus tanguticus]|uniref:formate--tetrahydrofolate ligase n=1 Tax=Anisodus tanguticus TaxID=243964 RepID=A0AAE1QN32_9SOLA|nr:hypothetical protein RND71_043573 [Anisodus tanguticus]